MNLAKFIFNFLFEGKCKIVLTFSNNNPPATHNFASPFVHSNDWDSLHKCCLCIIITLFCLFSCSFLLGKYSHDTRQRMSSFKFNLSALKYKFNILGHVSNEKERFLFESMYKVARILYVVESWSGIKSQIYRGTLSFRCENLF